jgi:glycosyltransferase involved in cell wall biosynthesis
MNILIFYQYFGTTKGGWSTRFYEFSKRWVQLGHQVTVVTSPYYKSDIKAEGFISKIRIEGIDIIIINTPDSNKYSFFKRSINSLLFSIVATYYALVCKCDVVISSSGPITVALPGFIAKFLKNVSFVFEVRDVWPEGAIQLKKLKNPTIISMALKFEEFIYKVSDLVVVCSIGMKENINFRFPQIQILNIPNSSDIELFSNNNSFPNFPNKFDTHLPIFLYAGSLGLMDDCEQIIKGFSKVPFGTANLVFLGDGAEKQNLIDACDKTLLNKYVWFLGLKPKDEVSKWFNISLASFVTFKNVPIFDTNSPNKLFDSLAAGVPVLQNTKGWIYDLVEKEKCGINFQANNYNSLTKSILKLCNDPQLVISLKLSAREVAIKYFDRNKLSDLYISNLISLKK